MTNRILIPSKGPDDLQQFLAKSDLQWATGYSARTLALRLGSGERFTKWCFADGTLEFSERSVRDGNFADLTFRRFREAKPTQDFSPDELSTTKYDDYFRI